MKAFLILYLVVVVLATFFEGVICGFENIWIYTPKDIKENSEMNWVGCVIVYGFTLDFAHNVCL